MIATRAKALTLLIDQNAVLERTIEQSDAYRDTTAVLVELNRQICVLIDGYQRVAGRLGPTVRSDLTGVLEGIKTGLRSIESDLTKNPRQGAEVKKLAHLATAASRRVNDAWRDYALMQLRPHQDVLGLVGFLPEIMRQRTQIDTTISRVRELSDSVPVDEQALKNFDDALAVLGDVLHEIEGISPTIRGFLQRVVGGQATVGDLNPEIMAWITERDRARAFQIRFGTATGQRFA